MSPETADAAFDEIVAAVTRGSRREAIRLAVAALAEGLDEPLVLLLAAESLDEQGHAPEALGLLHQAADIAPEEPDLWRRIGGILVRQGKLTEGLAALETALKLHPDFVEALIEAGVASFRLGGLTAAEAYFWRATGLAPGEAEPLAALAAIAARQRKPREARVLAERALVLQPDLVTAELAIGRADLVEGSAAEACARMTRLLSRVDLTEEHRVGALDLRAEAFDTLYRPGEAFADYEARNAILRRAYASRIEQEISERRIDQARRLVSYFSRTPAAPWRVGAGEDEIGARTVSGHAFLVGFPRSGTTLLEKVLAAHPGIVTLEEVDHLGQAGAHWLADTTALDSLADLGCPEADAARQAYWRSVNSTACGNLSGKLLLDKLPLHTLALAVIAKLFPRARILFALRDPRDVVLSCFRRRFQMNSAMFEFLSLEDTAAYYDAVMTLLQIYRGTLSLPLLDVRHETLVADFEATVPRVLEFLGSHWDPGVSRFAENRRADPRTPSDIQLARGLNAEGIGQWRRYQAQLSPVLASLTPWVEQFGYPP